MSATATTTTYAVEGMTCAHCVAAVTDEISGLSGVRDVQVDLVVGGRSAVRVISDGPIEPTAIAAAVDEAGYTLGEPDPR